MNDQIPDSFRSVTVELPIPNSLAPVVVFSPLASLLSVLNLFPSDRTRLCFLHIEAAISTTVNAY